MASQQWIRLGCGLDMSKSHFHACFGGQKVQGQFVVRAQRKFANTVKGIEQFLQWLVRQHHKLDAQKQLPFQLLVESTGVYHESVVYAAYQAGWNICVELARRVKQYLKSIGQESKTDKLDASGIARMASERQLRSWQPCSKNLYALRQVLRQRQALIKYRTSLQNQLHALRHSYQADAVVRQSLLDTHQQINEQITALEAHIKQLYEQDEQLVERLSPIIESVKGLGLITVLTIVAETNGFAQITSRKQLASYAGYDIIDNQSGQWQGRSRMSKQGNARIRQVMYMAALSLIRTKQGPLYDLYHRVRQRNPRIYKKANVAVQRKLLLLVFTLYKKQQRYDPEKYHTTYKTSSSGQSPELHEIESPKVTLPLEA